MKKNELKKMIKEEYKKVLSEGVKYPSQYDAEAMLEWYTAMGSIYLGGASQEIRTAIDKVENIRLKLHGKIFGDKSPWSIERKGSKTKVVWDDIKATKLGL